VDAEALMLESLTFGDLVYEDEKSAAVQAMIAVDAEEMVGGGSQRLEAHQRGQKPSV
jgi:hypothetical protein